jgi:isocitrate lyase
MTCRGIIILEMNYIDLFDTKHDNEIFSQRSMKAWSKSVQEIRFREDDTASTNFRKSGKMLQDNSTLQ